MLLRLSGLAYVSSQGAVAKPCSLYRGITHAVEQCSGVQLSAWCPCV